MNLEKSIWWRRFQTLSFGLSCWLLPLFVDAVTLEWDRNPETNVLGYRVYVGRQSRVYDSVLDVNNQTMAQFAAIAGKYYFAVTAYDTEGLESDFSDEVSYTPPWTNSAPTAAPDRYTAVMNVPRTVSPPAGVLKNDLDPDGHVLIAILTTPVTSGSVDLQSDGSFVYTPAHNFTGVVTFGYSVSDGNITSPVATVTITVSENIPLNGAPMANPDHYVTSLDVPLSVPVGIGLLRNDLEPDGDPMSALLISTVTSGALTLNGNGSFSYTPATGFLGVVGFTYATTDGRATSAVTAVTIVVNRDPAPAQNCVDCFVDLDGLLIAQSNRFRPVVEARLSVPTNVTCPKLGVLIFNTVSRAARTMNDPEMNHALHAAAECLVSNLRQEAAARSASASGLSPSKWTSAASNQISAAVKNLDRVLLSSNHESRAQLLAAAAAFLPRADKSIVTGNLAPLSLANKTATCKIAERGQAAECRFVFGDNSFAIEDENGILGVGQYTFSRTAWNGGLLLLGFEQPMLGYEAGDSVTLQLKFGRIRHRLISERLRGYFTFQD